MLLAQLATQYEISETRAADRLSLEELLVGDADRSQIVRTSVEDLTNYLDEQDTLPSLVKIGPSCVNI